MCLYLPLELKWYSGKGKYWQRSDTQGLSDGILTEKPDYFGQKESNKCLSAAFLNCSVKNNGDITSYKLKKKKERENILKLVFFSIGMERTNYTWYTKWSLDSYEVFITNIYIWKVLVQY